MRAVSFRVAGCRAISCAVLLSLGCGSWSQGWSQEASASQQASRQRFAALLREGSLALQRGDNAAAEKSFRKGMALAPTSVEMLNDLAISVARQGRADEAIALYASALKLKPGDAITSRNLGVAYFRAHRYQEALPLLQSYAQADPTFQSLNLTGLSLFALDRYGEAVVSLEAASRLQPGDLPTLDILGKAYWREKNYSGVTGVFDRIMAVDPKSPEAHFMMGLAYDLASREQEAFQEFEAALAADPSYPGVHSSLGLIDWRENKVAEAQAEFARELDRYPNDPISNYMLGQILRQQDKPALAVPYLEAAVTASPSYRDALFELGQCRLMLNQPAEAVRPLQKSIDADPSFAQGHFILGKAYAELGRTADATRERNLCRQLQEKQHAAANPQP